MIRLVAGCVVVALWAFCGCAKEEEPSGRLNTVLAHDSGSLPPVPLQRHQSDRLPPVSSDRFLAKIGGPASTGSEAEAKPVETSAPEATEESAEAIELHDDDPQALMEQLVKLQREGNLDTIALMVVPEQREIAQPILSAGKKLDGNLKRLLAAVNERDPEVAKRLLEMGGIGTGGRGPSVSQAMGEGPEATVDVEMQGDDRAIATIRIDELQFEQKRQLERVDDKWRLRMEELPPADQVPAAVSLVEKMATAAATITNRLTNDEITVNDVERELGAAMQRAMQETMSGAGGDAGAPPAPRPPQPPGPNRTRSGRDADNEQPTAEELIGRS